MKKLLSLIRSDRFRELVRYGVIGVLTTAINYGVYWAMTKPLNRLLFGSNEPGIVWMNVAIFVSWVLSVLFAFIANKKWVFNSSGSVWKELIPFAGARVASYFFDELFVNIAVSLGMNDLIAKLLSNVIVVIINYFASRLIFKKKEEKAG